MIRIGSGFDVHKFGDAHKPLIIGGVEIAYESGFFAHSDGDVLLHAICDAILGALALGDIGKFFPDNDPAFKGANSRELLKEVALKMENLGYEIGNIDSTIIAQAPKMRPHIDLMRQNIADDLNIAIDQVNVKATTTEKLGFTGRGEGIACEAVVLLHKKTKDY